MNAIKEYKVPIIIALIQWLLTTIFRVDRLFFDYDHVTKWMLATKAIYLAVLLLAWCFGFFVYRKIKEQDEYYRRGLFIFLGYFILMLVVLLVLWPGTWAWDDWYTLITISGYESWNPWQHVITGAYQDVMLQILPFPGGLILLQNMIISLCVAFSVTKLESIFGIGRWKNRWLDLLVKILPFLMPPVLLYQFSGYRIGLYVYLELVMLVMLIGAWKDKCEWNVRYLLLFSLLGIVVATWRTESLLYIPFICLLLLFVEKKVLPRKKKVLCMLLLVAGFIGMNQFQNHWLGNSNYEVITLLRPCAELVRAADEVEDKECLEAIDQVVSLDVIREHPTMNGEDLYWHTDVVRSGYTKEAYSDFLSSVVKLSIKYPKVVVAERWSLFLKTSGVTGESESNVSLAATLYEQENGFVEGTTNTAMEAVKQKGWFANTPISQTLRKNAIYFLGMRNSLGHPMDIPQRVIWNSVIPICLLIYAWFCFLIRKKWYLFGVATAVLIRVPVVILTQPSAVFMYLLSFYFLGYTFLIYHILTLWSRKKERKEQTSHE